MKVKNFLKVLFITLILFAISNTKITSSAGNPIGNTKSIEVYEEYKRTLLIEKEQELRLQNIRTYFYFLEDLGYIESRNSYTIINSRNYMGRFQFGWPALHATGYKHINWRKFRKNPNIWKPKDQVIAMNRLLTINKRNMRNVSKDYLGLSFGDTLRVTESGLLAACHLAGSGRYQTYKKNGKIHKKGRGVKYFLQSNGEYNPSDGHMRISDYMYKFSGYRFDIPEETELLTYYNEYGDTY